MECGDGNPLRRGSLEPVIWGKFRLLTGGFTLPLTLVSDLVETIKGLRMYRSEGERHRDLEKPRTAKNVKRLKFRRVVNQ